MNNFTSAQQAAIAARGNVLVVAGAGTGKTRTLIARVLALLREGASLDQMLLVTFTEAAAAELRARLRKGLEDELKAVTNGASPSPISHLPSPGEALAEQVALLDTAQISTLHGFCLRLVREHFHQLAIDPQLVILDERQTRPLARETLTALLAEHYAGRHAHSAGVQALVRRGGRGADEHVRALVEKLHGYAQSLPDPDAWFAAQLAQLRNPAPTQWTGWLHTALAEWRAEWLPAFATVPDVPPLRRCAAALQRGATDHAALEEILASDADWPRGTKTKFRPAFKKFFEEAEFLHSQFGPDGSTTPLSEDWEWSRLALAALVELTRQFTARFGEAKRQLGGVDFADLEQFSLRLLRDEATGVARQCRERFAHVGVDEYQDINAAQDAILRLVSRVGADANRFLVGDLKQSIYRFRLAEPRIFAGYATAWRTAAKPTSDSVLALAENFRSREAVLNFVNPLFRALLRESVGGVRYDAEAELQFGGREQRQALSGAAQPPRVELHVLTTTTDDAENESSGEPAATRDLLDLLAVEREARGVALRLRALHEAGHRLWDETLKAERPVAWCDMVVLLRSPRSRAEAFAQEFHRAGVPLHAERGGFYEALEVSDLLNLLRLLDNPLQDLPLLAVLRSPLVALSLEELVAIRAHNHERLFWDALTKFCAAGEPPITTLGRAGSPLPAAATDDSERRARSDAPYKPAHSAFAKASAFLARFAAWRERIRLASLTECVEQVLTETHYEALLQAEPRGAERSANVRRLLDLARQFDPYQRQGLHRFLQFIAAQAEAELDHEAAPALTADAVRLMSIHQSKGLEFPVVVLAGLGTRFNEQDLRGDILLDAEFGLCPLVAPPESERRYASLPHWLARRRGRRELLGEELRLLYVALTRARDTLLLTGTDAGKDALTRWRGPAEPLTDAALLQARSPLDWLRAWFPSVTHDAEWHDAAAGENALFHWEFYAADDARLAANAECGMRNAECASAADERCPVEVETKLRALLDWHYAHDDATREPAKTSVTVLRRRAAEADDAATPWFRPRGTARPARSELTAAQRGVAHHAFLQNVDLARTATPLDLRNEAARLVAAGLLTERDAAALDFAALLTFWESTVGRQVRAQAGRVQREVPFTARFTVTELTALGLLKPPAATASPSALRTPHSAFDQSLLTSAATANDEFLIVQGVADLVVFGAEEIWLLDYKTDHFAEPELAAKLGEYGPQLTLYALALERIYRRPVTRTWLHFLAHGRTELL